MAAKASPTKRTFMRDYQRGFVVLLAALTSIALTARLGFWQLDRAAQKVAMQTALASRAQLPVLYAKALARTPAAADEQQYRRVDVAGRWLPERTVFLDNRQMDGRVGFFVVTPLLIEGNADAVLVQRGWVPRHFDDRTALPAIPSAPGRVEVVGSVASPPSRLYQFEGAASGPIRQNLDVVAFARETGLALLPLSIQQYDTPGTPRDILLRDWPPPASDVQKHYGYAFQWFAIAIGIAALHVWYRHIRPRRQRPVA